MTHQNDYSSFIYETNSKGSNKANSYIRALDLLGPILAQSSSDFSTCSNLWSVDSVEMMGELYEYIIEQQKLEDRGIFSLEHLPSYWRSGFYSAALKSYKEFLIIHHHEKRLLTMVDVENIDPADLAQQLASEEVESIVDLIDDVDFSTQEGKEKLREVKTRLNQGVFRKVILRSYGTQCCVTGLNIPQVLRASHIVGWAEDEANRMNFTNGLCLSATYDAAFDRHLISFDKNYRMMLSSELNEYCGNEAFEQHFKAFEGQTIAMPNRFAPDQVFLKKHRKKLAS